jgi:hypothetical protein
VTQVGQDEDMNRAKDGNKDRGKNRDRDRGEDIEVPNIDLSKMNK